jgi:Leucine-rich repeat (LRR) protein
MEFLFEVAGLPVPLVQEIVFLAQLEYDDVLDCLKPPYYFIPKNSISIENHAGHNVATHAQLENPKWIGVPPDTSNEIVKQLIQKVLGQNVKLTRYPNQILYSLQSDRQFLQEQNEKYGWNYHWQYEVGNEEWKDCIFNNQNRLIKFNCSYKQQIKELDVSQCTQLQQLCCWNNRFKELDVTTCTQLQEFYCSNTQIKELDVSQCTQLQTLLCSNTQIKELDVSQCTQLQELDCYNTQIKELDVSQCTQLQKLRCYETQLKELDASQCTQLQQLWCSKDIKLIGDVHNIHVTRR